MTQVYLLAAVLVAATAFGLWRRSVDGRMRDLAPQSVVPSSDRPASPSGQAPAVAQAGAQPDLADPEPDWLADHVGLPAPAEHPAGAQTLTAADVGQELGDRATLLQFSSAFCAPCRTARLVLGEVAGMVEGVEHVEIDAADNLDLARQLSVTRTPTVFVLDAAGRIRTRATGAPRKPEVVAALGKVI